MNGSCFRYTISVQWDHVVPGFPYISETGTLSPESCIFAQCLNIAALLRMYIRSKSEIKLDLSHTLRSRFCKIVKKIEVKMKKKSK